MFEEEEPPVAALELERETNDLWYSLTIVKEVQQRPRDFLTFKLAGGRLYKYEPNEVIDESLCDDDAWKLAVPHEKRREVLRECHDFSTAGHLGREKTLERVRRKYYWPHMSQDVAKYVNQCRICQQFKVELQQDSWDAVLQSTHGRSGPATLWDPYLEPSMATSIFSSSRTSSYAGSK